jgi:hypothetical protein
MKYIIIDIIYVHMQAIYVNERDCDEIQRLRVQTIAKSATTGFCECLQ